MDPLVLSRQAISLNLDLMRWRLAPDLKLDAIANSKVLILGMGTLGCNVARVLLGWNVTAFTLVDNGTVSYSNLARQPLYVHADYGRSKVEAARDNLLAIAPHLKIDSLQLTIPSPGHHSALRNAGTESPAFKQLEKELA